MPTGVVGDIYNKACTWIRRRRKISKGNLTKSSSRRRNRQHTVIKRQTSLYKALHKKESMLNTNTIQVWGWYQVFRMGKQFLLFVRTPSYITHVSKISVLTLIRWHYLRNKRTGLQLLQLQNVRYYLWHVYSWRLHIQKQLECCCIKIRKAHWLWKVMLSAHSHCKILNVIQDIDIRQT